MNAVSTIEKPAKAPIVAGGKITAMVPQNIEQTFRLSQAIAQSGMAPKSYSNDPNKILVGIIAGMEIGLAPMTALQSIAVIGNMPAIWGDGALALVQGSGLLTDLEETDDGHTATCRAVREGNPTPIIRSFSMDQAKQAGLSGKSGPWTQYPARMRQMRARLLVLRDGFADVLKGIRIAEEVRDYPPEAFGDDAIVAPRITRAALENHASVNQDEDTEQGRADHEHGDQFDDTNTPQSPSPDSLSSDEGTDTAVEQEAGEDQSDGDAPAHDDAEPWQGMVDDWKDRITKADVVGTVISIRGEMKPHREALPDDVVADLDRALDDAAAKFTTKG